MNAIEVSGLRKTYQKFELSDISFVLPRGYIMGYVGQNGAGKTTTLSLIAHLIKADAGSCMVNGLTYEKDPVRYREAIGYVGDSDGFTPDFTLKNIRTVCRDFYPTFRERQFDEFTERWKLPEKKKLKEFSRGMRVKLQFAMALARDTSVLLLDEATNGLDPVVRAEVLEILQDYIGDGGHSILFSTHILSDLEQIADYIFFIDNGRKIFCETKEDLQESYLLAKGGPEDLNDGGKCLIGVKESGVGFEALVRTDDAPLISKGCLLEKPTIDQIIVHLIRQSEHPERGKTI